MNRKDLQKLDKILDKNAHSPHVIEPSPSTYVFNKPRFEPGDEESLHTFSLAAPRDIWVMGKKFSSEEGLTETQVKEVESISNPEKKEIVRKNYLIRNQLLNAGITKKNVDHLLQAFSQNLSIVEMDFQFEDGWMTMPSPNRKVNILQNEKGNLYLEVSIDTYPAQVFVNANQTQSVFDMNPYNLTDTNFSYQINFNLTGSKFIFKLAQKDNQWGLFYDSFSTANKDFAELVQGKLTQDLIKQKFFTTNALNIAWQNLLRQLPILPEDLQEILGSILLKIQEIYRVTEFKDNEKFAMVNLLNQIESFFPSYQPDPKLVDTEAMNTVFYYLRNKPTLRNATSSLYDLLAQFESVYMLKSLVSSTPNIINEPLTQHRSENIDTNINEIIFLSQLTITAHGVQPLIQDSIRGLSIGGTKNLFSNIETQPLTAVQIEILEQSADVDKEKITMVFKVYNRLITVISPEHAKQLLQGYSQGFQTILTPPISVPDMDVHFLSPSHLPPFNRSIHIGEEDGELYAKITVDVIDVKVTQDKLAPYNIRLDLSGTELKFKMKQNNQKFQFQLTERKSGNNDYLEILTCFKENREIKKEILDKFVSESSLDLLLTNINKTIEDGFPQSLLESSKKILEDIIFIMDKVSFPTLAAFLTQLQFALDNIAHPKEMYLPFLTDSEEFKTLESLAANNPVLHAQMYNLKLKLIQLENAQAKVSQLIQQSFAELSVEGQQTTKDNVSKRCLEFSKHSIFSDDVDPKQVDFFLNNAVKELSAIFSKEEINRYKQLESSQQLSHAEEVAKAQIEKIVEQALKLDGKTGIFGGELVILSINNKSEKFILPKGAARMLECFLNAAPTKSYVSILQDMVGIAVASKGNETHGLFNRRDKNVQEFYETVSQAEIPSIKNEKTLASKKLT